MINDPEGVLVESGIVCAIGAGVAVYNFVALRTRVDANVEGNSAWAAVGSTIAFIALISVVICAILILRGDQHRTNDDDQ